MFHVSLVDIPNNESAKVLYLSGDMNSDALSDMRNELDSIFESSKEVSRYIFHFRDVTSISSLVIGYLADAYEKMSEGGCSWSFAEADEDIKDVLDLVGFLNLVDYYPTLKQSVQALEL